jgi:hypothetical protein
MRFGRGGGARKASVVVRVAVQKAVVEGGVPAVGVQVAGVESAVAPFMNCTVPVGPAPVLVVETFAVRVMLPPDLMVVAELVTAVVVASPAVVIVNGTAPELLVVKLGSPLYLATIECEPTANVAIPPAVNASLAALTCVVATAVALPLSKKLTVPVGSSTPLGLMVACRKSVVAGPLVKVAQLVLEVIGRVHFRTLAVAELFALLTVTVTGAETLGANVPSPP